MSKKNEEQIRLVCVIYFDPNTSGEFGNFHYCILYGSEIDSIIKKLINHYKFVKIICERYV